jgi:hypothetical protein
MYSKSKAIATGVAVLFLASCGSVLPWHDEPVADEVNLAFTIENNLLFLTTVRIENRPGRFFFGSAAAHTAIDPRFVPSPGAVAIDVGQKEAVHVTPVYLDLGKSGDALIGADVWGNHAISIDYRSGLLTFQREGIHPEGMALFRYDADPSVDVSVDGRTIPAIVDTALPDTIVLPRATPGRGRARVVLGGTDFGAIDVGYANVPRARLGNRVLSKFLVTIDYGRREVGLWRDPRIPM